MSNQVTAPSRAKRAKGARLAARPPKRFPLKKIVLAAAAVILLAVVGALTYGLTYDRIYPNVYVGGLDLGGQTVDSAVRLLEEQLGAQYGGKVIPFVVSGEETELALEQAGIRFQADASARQAWEYGREGGFSARVGVVVSSVFSRKDFELSSDVYIDDSAVEALVVQTAAHIDIPAVASGIEVKGAEISITMGFPGRKVDTAKLTELITEYLRRGDYSQKLLYDPMPTKPQPVDLNALYALYCFPPENARLEVSDKTNITVMPEQDGRTFDEEAARSALEAAAPGQVVTIPLKAVPASINAAVLGEKLFADELSTLTTYLDAGNKPRVNNIRLAASYINGCILLPGDVFSFNGVVGERTTAKGYQQAGAYVNGRLVDETGGGICQMATTTYGAAVRANLKIVERSNHSMTVGYVPLGQDATVNWGTTDLKFQNDTEYPIKVLAEQSGGYVKVTIIGTKTNDNTVTFESTPLSNTPFETQTVVNPDLAPGARKVTVAGHNGATAVSYRVIKDKNGNVISKTEEARSRYNKVNQVVEVGPGGVSTPAPETPTPGTPEPGTPEPPPETPPETAAPPETSPPEETPPPAEPTPDASAPVDSGGNDVWEE